jgi:hypothetical protein
MLKTKLSITLVYSTETDRICPDCNQQMAQCQHVATVMAALMKLGYAVKRSGG